MRHNSAAFITGWDFDHTDVKVEGDKVQVSIGWGGLTLFNGTHDDPLDARTFAGYLDSIVQSIYAALDAQTEAAA